jgi:hypothetical protein
VTTAIFILLVLLALSFVCVIWALDVAEDRRDQGAYRASAKQRRAWARERREAGWGR